MKVFQGLYFCSTYLLLRIHSPFWLINTVEVLFLLIVPGSLSPHSISLSLRSLRREISLSYHQSSTKPSVITLVFYVFPLFLFFSKIRTIPLPNKGKALYICFGCQNFPTPEGTTFFRISSFFNVFNFSFFMALPHQHLHIILHNPHKALTTALLLL